MRALELLAALPFLDNPPTRGTWFAGLINGLVTGLLAMGIVLIYRSTRVINFAVGNMGLPGASLFALLVINWGWPFWPALLVSLTLGALIGAVIELTVVWRLFHRPRVILLVATVGLAQLLAAVNQSLPRLDTDQAQIRFPTAIGTTWDDVLGLTVTGPNVQILIAVPLLALSLACGSTAQRLVRPSPPLRITPACPVSPESARAPSLPWFGRLAVSSPPCPWFC